MKEPWVNVIVRVNLLWNNGVNYYLCSEIQEEAVATVSAHGFSLERRIYP
ncbi:hypothetical protein [uncultured Duncaniella sp.]|nr:hypothetical protein [uncultured Duncaniella sp.]